MSDERTVRVTVTELSAGLMLSGDGAVEIGKKLKYGESIDLDITYRPVPTPPEPRRWVFEETGEVRQPRKGDLFEYHGEILKGEMDPAPDTLKFRLLRLVESPAPAPAKRRVRKLELRERRKGDKYMLCNDHTAEYDTDGLAWVIVEEAEEEVSDGQ